MDYLIVAILIGVIILFVFFAAFNSRNNERQRLLIELKRNFGKLSGIKLEEKQINKIRCFSDYLRLSSDFYVDEITANDLDLARFFSSFNVSRSSVGDEYIYASLRNLSFDEAKLKKRDKVISFFENNEDETRKLQLYLSEIGKNRRGKSSIFEHLSLLINGTPGSNAGHIVLILLLALAIATLFIQPVIGIIGLIFMVCLNVWLYYRYKAKVNEYFTSIKHVSVMLKAAKKISSKSTGIIAQGEAGKLISEIGSLCSILKPVTKGSGVIGSADVRTSLADVVLDYVRIILHVDLIAFNIMLRKAAEHEKDLIRLYELLGELELAIAAASFRTYLNGYCRPDFENAAAVSFEKIYHPLSVNAVTNDMASEKMVLLTGSNASGKSTFLKAVALNAILAQSIYTCAADTFTIPFVRVYSSMALKDNLEKGESYYIVEIKSLKRILDAVDAGSARPVLCFVDEVLRGTNTIERIAASSEILRSLAGKNVICFTATHDIELTEMLATEYSNYHFDEEITENDVKFNYLLKKGHATTRNAIKLLKKVGYDAAIIDAAEKVAESTGGKYV